MERIKSRLALTLATAAVASAFTVTPAVAADDCDYPNVVCNAAKFVQYCVWFPIHTGQMPGDECSVSGT